MTTSKSLKWLLGLLLITGLATAVQAERLLGNFQNLQAFAPSHSTCGPIYKVIARAPDEAPFAGDKVDLQRFLGGLRAMLSFECAQAKKIVISGQVGNREVYRGTAAAADGWALVDVAACDRLAADSHDPRRATDGVDVSQMDTEQAIEACIADVQADPENIRFRYQLGRSLVAHGTQEDAMQFLEEAAAQDYPAALYYLVSRMFL